MLKCTSRAFETTFEPPGVCVCVCVGGGGGKPHLSLPGCVCGGGGTPIYWLYLCAAGKGMVFKPFTLE